MPNPDDSVDILGHVTFYQYDGFGNITRVTYQDGAQQTYVYDLAGRRTAETDPAGVTKTYEYDGAGRVTKATDALGNFTTFTYTGDALRPATVTDPLGHVTQYGYDFSLFGANLPVSTTYADSSSRSQTWEPGGQIASETDENGHITSYAYGGARNLVQVTDALGGITTYGYDEAGNRVSQTDPNGHTTTYRYDALGNMVSRTLPGGQTETFTYDANDNRLTRTDFNGQTTSYTYDSMNRVLTETRPGGETVTNTYAPNGMIATATISGSPARSWTYSYDGRNRLSQVVQSSGGVPVSTITYQYDPAGRRTQLASPAGTVDFSFDAAGRLATVVDPNGQTTTYNYDAASRLMQRDNANGTHTTFAYDTRNRPTSISQFDATMSTLLAQQNYTYDPEGRRLTVSETKFDATTRNVAYTYDALNRLLTENDGTLLTTYTYDPAGNRLTRDINGSVENYIYDANDRIMSAGTLTFSYDSNGNTMSVSDGATTMGFQYDPLDRVKKITETGIADIDFAYDHSGSRVERSVSGAVTRFVVDPNDPSGLTQVLAELDGAGTAHVGYVIAKQILSRLSDGAEGDSYLQADAIGSTRTLTNAAGAVTDTYDYSAFGLATHAGTNPNAYQFTGERSEADGALVHLRARDMMPAVGRFLTMDKHQPNRRNPVTLNRYVYAGNDPVNMVDPTGNQFDMGSVSISISISADLDSMSYSILLKPPKDIEEVIDKAKELLVNIPKLKLNESTERSELGFTPWAVVQEIWDNFKYDPGKFANVGDGAVGKAYEVLEGMTNTAGKYIMQILKYDSSLFLRILPSTNNLSAPGATDVPGNYLACSFNRFVQKTYGLSLIADTEPAKKIPHFEEAANVLALWLGYFTMIELASDTLDDWAYFTVPAGPSDTCGPF